MDAISPVIMLTGANPQTIEAGDSYTELGATASDNYEGDISDSIIIDASALNTSVVGIYTVTYDVTDTAGNSGIRVTRTVDVVDNQAPTLSIGAPSLSETTSGPVDYTVTYTGADTVTLVAGDITLNTTGTATGDVAVTGTGATTRTVGISNITGDGTLGISIGANTASDTVGNQAAGAGPSAPVIVDLSLIHI